MNQPTVPTLTPEPGAAAVTEAYSNSFRRHLALARLTLDEVVADHRLDNGWHFLTAIDDLVWAWAYFTQFADCPSDMRDVVEALRSAVDAARERALHCGEVVDLLYHVALEDDSEAVTW